MNRLKEKLHSVKQHWKQTRGALVTESTFVYPIMFFIVFFMIFFGNMFCIRAGIDQLVTEEAIESAARYADPSLAECEDGIPTTLEDAPRVTKNLYRYLDVFDLGGSQSVSTGNIKEGDGTYTGFFSGMNADNIEVVKHHVNNYIVYQTYEVEVHYKLKFPWKFIFNDERIYIPMIARAEVPVTDSAEFIRNVDMAIDMFERSEGGEDFFANADIIYGKVRDFLNGENANGEAVAGGVSGGVPGVDGRTGQEKIDYYAEGLITESGNVNSARLHQIALDIQKGKVTSEEIKLLNKKVAELGITKEYETEMKKIDFGTYLTIIKGPKPSNMDNAHAHHILYKEGNGPGQKALVEEGQAILRKYGIDPIVGEENLVWAPNITGQHVKKTHLKPLVDELKAVDAKGGSYEQIAEVLERHGEIASEWKAE